MKKKITKNIKIAEKRSPETLSNGNRKEYSKKIDDETTEIYVSEILQSPIEIEKIVYDYDEDEEFNSFFNEVLRSLPKKTASIIMKSYDKSKKAAEKILAQSKSQVDKVSNEFMKDVDDTTRKKCHKTIHAAALTAAIIGCSPIPFSDALLLVPVQLVMMARLHKIFGKPWTDNLAKSLTREIGLVSLSRSVVGNALKFIPVVGTVAGSAINATVATSVTEALGWVTVKMLNEGVDIFDEVMTFNGQVQKLYKVLMKKK